MRTLDDPLAISHRQRIAHRIDLFVQLNDEMAHDLAKLLSQQLTQFIEDGDIDQRREFLTVVCHLNGKHRSWMDYLRSNDTVEFAARPEERQENRYPPERGAMGDAWE